MAASNWIHRGQWTAGKWGEGYESIRDRAWANLEGCQFLDGASCSIAELLEWEKLVDNTAPAAYKTILILRTVETFMFSSSLRLNADRGDAESICPKDMRSLVTVYQRTARQWRQLPRLTSILGVEQRSRELLVLWIAFCLVHQRCIESVPLCAKYGIAVKWQDLKVAVASDKAAIQALQRVARYIRRWEEAVGGPPLFHLSNQQPTLDFARTFSGNDAALAAFYNQEVSAWNGYLQTMWNKIKQKKGEAADLRAEIDRLNQGLQETQTSLAAEVARLTLEENARRATRGYRWNNIGNSVTRQYKIAIRSINDSISRTEVNLWTALAMPCYLVKPLPPQKTEALQVIFFLTMPRDLEILGDLCLAAQRALAPSGPTAEMRAMPNVSPTTWLQHYSQYAQSTTFPRQSKVITTSPSPYRLPRLYGPQTVDELSSITQYEAQCVWNPTFNGSALTWKDASGVNVNPFAASPESVLESYTEKLSGDFRQLQWMNSYTGGDTRGNLVYASFSQQPETFEKVSFIALGTLRAFPNQQYRKLLAALLDDTLPWSHPSVEIIVRQSLYQVGEITDDDDARLLWKTDMFDMLGGLNTFCAILRSVASKLEQTPREFQGVPLLSEVTGYLHQFTGEANTIVKAFARMTRRWAEDALLECAKESSASRIAEIRAKECVLYGFALLSYTLGPWDDAVARDVCELLVLFRTSFLCASINRQSSSELLRIQSRIDEVMTRRISTVINFALERGGDKLLTSLVRLVYRTAPSRLKWNRFTDVTSASAQFGNCVEAFDQPTETHYAINLFTGSVLANGNAPGGLPSDIRDHERFKMQFGLSNFEATSTNGVLRTVREFYDRYYDFALLDGGDLFVQELCVDGNGAVNMTLQLCSLEWIGAFGKAFPARLRELYSHWYWVERDCVLLRPTVANQRRVFFVATFDKAGVLRCYKVPLSDMERPYQGILDSLQQYDSFVRLEQPLLKVLDVLTKFESKQFFHSLRSPQGVLKIELPRFKLTFQLDADLQLESVEHRGYVLAPNQQFDDFLPRFSRYLVLKLRNAFDTSASELRVIVPMGVVKESPGGMVDVDISHEASGNISTACYEEHRRLRVFQAATICARLQLAAIYTRAGTNVPSRRLQMTGAEAALQVLRSCCSSRPFAASETALLLNVCTLSYREPAVKLLAVVLLSKAERLAFLFGQEVKTSRAMSSTHENTEYHEMCGKEIQRNPLRSQFRKTEERLALGHVTHAPVCIAAKERVTLDPIPVIARYAKAVETQLGLFLSCSNSPAVKMPPLPLRQDNCESVMSKDMLMELRVSWESYHSQADVALNAPLSTLLGAFTTLLADVGHHRQAMETYLSSCFDKATASKGDRLLALINYVPTLTVSDLVSCSFDDDTLHTLMPKLSVEDRKQFKVAVLRFMELCVLEDKMERLVWKVKSGREASISQLVDELSNVRQWQSTEFPYWLAFEVEGRLQIRHEQFVIARHLIEQPGTVCQLNMGRGKTRVILPMLFLHFTRSRCRRIVRAHFLGPLLSEARQFMHRFLSASSARLDIFEQPFHRQVKLGVRGLEIMHDTLEEMKLFGGVQVVAPEHRMSLELKRLELGGSSGAESDEMEAALDTILENDKYIDVLDECDALLHHKYHLVYAVGAPASLCSGVERWKAAEALLGAVASKADSRVAKVLRAPNVSCASPDYKKRLGAFNGVRLSAVAASTEALRSQLKEALVQDVIDSEAFELLWTRTFRDGDARRQLVATITDPSVSLEDALQGLETKFTPYVRKLLALRGLVAFGVLEHCLEKRYRVDFGLPAPGTRQKKIAIPFRAADVPSERSEFSHPDVCIVLTLLSYYHGGLTSEEVRSAFRMLLRLDLSEQDREYEQWYASVSGELTEEERQTLCDVRHVSLADSRQFELLCRVYKFCMGAINFHLNTSVFPKDTQQYPHRLSRTAWNLAAGDQIVGFSGTNDNHRLLPLSVAQREPEEPSLLGTNGKMIHRILQVTKSYEVVRPTRHFPIPWQSVLRFAVDKRAQALIDTGALLAGVMNHEAAEFLLRQSDLAFAGVTYYDSRTEWNCWMVAEKARRVVMPLKSATMLEKDTFVIFEEARSRGSDMKLPTDAAAVLTLGPRLTKDKLMQGAGRMRQLGCHQTLWMASFDEVAQSVLQSSKRRRFSRLSALDVLDWVMQNTQAEAVRGLMEWAGNGLHFRRTRLDGGAELVTEDWSLETLYGANHQAEKIARVIQSKAVAFFGDSNAQFDDALVSAICRRGLTYGLDNEVCVTSHTDECERELQLEEEVQQERELEVAKCSPAREKPWDYSRILRAQSVQDLESAVCVVDMKSFIHKSVSPDEMAGLDWDAAHIFGTRNFFSTVVARASDALNEFLRAIDVLLAFDNGQILLVSECEADHILGLLWANCSGATSSGSFRFVNLPFACEAIDRTGVGVLFRDVHLALGSRLHERLPLLSTAACQLYNGETMLAKRQPVMVEPAFRELLQPLTQREETLSDYVCSRGKSHKWTRSFLHELCRCMDVEDCAS